MFGFWVCQRVFYSPNWYLAMDAASLCSTFLLNYTLVDVNVYSCIIHIAYYYYDNTINILTSLLGLKVVIPLSILFTVSWTHPTQKFLFGCTQTGSPSVPLRLEPLHFAKCTSHEQKRAEVGLKHRSFSHSPNWKLFWWQLTAVSFALGWIGISIRISQAFFPLRNDAKHI